MEFSSYVGATDVVRNDVQYKLGTIVDKNVAVVAILPSSLTTTLQRLDSYGISQDVELSCKELEEYYPGITKRVYGLILDELRNNSVFQEMIDEAVQGYIQNYNPLNLTQSQ